MYHNGIVKPYVQIAYLFIHNNIIKIKLNHNLRNSKILNKRLYKNHKNYKMSYNKCRIVYYSK